MQKYFVTMSPSIQKEVGAEGYVIEAEGLQTRDGTIIFGDAEHDHFLIFSTSAIVSIEVVTDEDIEYIEERALQLQDASLIQ